MKASLFWQDPDLPIIIQKFYVSDNTLKLLEESRSELEKLIRERSDGKSKTWGYFPELNPEVRDYPKTNLLAEEFSKEVINKHELLAKFPLQLAFVRRAISEPKSEFGGFHIDVNAGIGHEWPKDVSLEHEVLRLLFNLDIVPRTLAYYPYTLEDISKKTGIKLNRREYEILDLPPDLRIKKIDIPPREKNIIYGLAFISTQIPHAGETTASGHFLISFGGYSEIEKIKEVFQK